MNIPKDLLKTELETMEKTNAIKTMVIDAVQEMHGRE